MHRVQGETDLVPPGAGSSLPSFSVPAALTEICGKKCWKTVVNRHPSS